MGLIAAVALAALLQTSDELNSTLAFYGTPKVPVYEITVPNLIVGEILDVESVHVVAPYSPLYGGYIFTPPAFVAAQIRLRSTSAVGLESVPLDGAPIDEANGSDIYVGGANYYQHMTRHGRFVVPASMAGQTGYIQVIAWCFSAAAGRWDFLTIVPGYGHLSVLRMAP